MCIVWDNEPLQSHDLVKLCNEKLGWKKSTTYTMLKKLCEKEFARNDNSTITSLVPKERVQEFASEQFIENSFDGSLPKFLTAFFGNKKISNKQANELKKLIDSYKEG